MKDSDLKLYNKVIEEVEDLVDRVLIDCEIFADKNDYDREWIVNCFKEKLNKRIREMY